MKLCFYVPVVVLFVAFLDCAAYLITNFQKRNAFRSQTILRSKSIGDSSSVQQQEQKRRALELLECLTSPSDPDDPNYDAEKDVRRDELLLANDYYELKLELKDRGLRSNGDKLEMIARLLLNVIDPNMDYNPIGQVATSLSYVNQTDLDTKKITRVEDADRPPPATIDDPDLDADDIQTLKRRSLYSKVAKQPARVIMDGLSRRQVAFSTQRVTDDSNILGDKANAEIRSIDAYVVGGRDVLKTWQSTASVVVFVPNTLGWKHKANRVLADEIAFSNQAIVVVPDIDPSRADSTWRATLGRLIATLHYCRNEYRPKSISLAGVEEGAAVAARATCDLWDIASHSLARLPDIPVTTIKSAATGRSVLGDEDSEEESVKSTNKTVASGTAGRIVLGYAQRVALQTRRDEDAYSNIIFEDNPPKENRKDRKDDVGNAETSQSVLDLSLDTDSENMNSESLSVSEDMPSTVDLASATETEVVDESEPSPDTGALMRELMQELGKAAAANSPSKSSGDDKSASPQEEALREQNRAKRRALERDLEIDASERVVSSGLLGAQSTLKPAELALLAPRALLCLCPVGLDTHSVATRLRPPSAFIFHSTSPDRLLPDSDKDNVETPHDTPDESTVVHALLSGRKTSIEDFCVRVYESCSDRFVSQPASLLESKGRQDALFVGAFWLDAYARDAVKDRAGRAGKTKFDADRSFFTVSREHLQDLKYAGDTMATYLHEDGSSTVDSSDS